MNLENRKLYFFTFYYFDNVFKVLVSNEDMKLSFY